MVINKIRIKIKNIFLLFLCFLIFFIRGKSNKKIDNPNKVLIAQLAKIGDMVCATPMFKAVKKKYPKSKLYVLGNYLNKELLQGNLDVDKYIIFDNNIFKLIKILNKEKIDFACLTGPDFNCLATLYISGISSITAPWIKGGFSPYLTKPYRCLLKFVINKEHIMGNYAPREYLKLLEPIEILDKNTRKHLSFSGNAEDKILNFFSNNNILTGTDFIVGIAPSAGNKIKLWQRNKFAQLADFIYKKYNAKIIIIGGQKDKQVAEEMTRFLNKDIKFIKCLGFFNLDELKALISKLTIFISVDSGPIYIAEAFNIPTIDIVGPMDDKEQPPMGKLNKIVKIEDRKHPELHVMNSRIYNKKEAKRQISEITVDMVINKFEQLMLNLIPKI